MGILRRQECYEYSDGTVNCYNNAWDNWVRWLVLGLIILAAILLFFAFTCISARRRRRAGYQPYRGTGWTLGHTPPGHAPATYNQPYYQQPYNAAPPAYTPPPNNGYYGHDVELQHPQNVYGGYRSGEGKPPPPGQS